jgi:hypothetical protein
VPAESHFYGNRFTVTTAAGRLSGGKRRLIDRMASLTRVAKTTVFSYLLCGPLLSQKSVPIQDPSDPQRARVSGIVLNERTQPLAGITVQATPPRPIGAILPHTRTDMSGRFVLAGLLPGHTYVNAFDEEAFYPNAISNFWDGEGAAEVELPSGGEVSGIVLTLKPVGRLEVKAATGDSDTAVGHIAVRLERDGDSTRWISGSKTGNSWLIPTAAVRLCVQAEGFFPTWYGGDGSFVRSKRITVKPREIFAAVVWLTPVPKPAVQPTCFHNTGR